MLDNYKDIQPIAYKILINAVKKNKISHAYLFVSNFYPKTLDFAKDFAKYLLCPYNYSNFSCCKDCKQCNNIDNNNYTEIKIIQPDGLWIKKEQLSELQEEFKNKALQGNKKIYIINRAECLNPSAANSILKFLEEPEENIIAILTVDNIYQLLDTIISRCQIIPLNKLKGLEKEKYEDNLKTRLAIMIAKTQEEIDLYTKEEYEEKIKLAIEFINKYEQQKIDMLLQLNQYFHRNFANKNDIIYAFTIFILYYKDILNKKINQKLEIFKEYESEIENITKNNEKEKIINKMNLLIEAKSKIYLNANIDLLMDKLIIDMEGGIKC